MDKTFLVIRHELHTTFSRRSYLAFAFGVPLLAVVIVLGMRLIQARTGASSPQAESIASSHQPSALETEGVVDHSGLIRSIPEEFDAGGKAAQGGLVTYTNENQAKEALKAGVISAYYVIPADYLKTGKVAYVYPNTRPYRAGGQEWVIDKVLTINLIGNDPELADQIWNPVWRLDETNLGLTGLENLAQGEDCSRPGMTCQSNSLIRYLPSILVAFLYVTLLVSSSMLFNSVAVEKENRAIEVLMSSLHPGQLMTGKILAIGLTGLIQTLAWLGTTFVLLGQRGTILQIPEEFTLPPGLLVWSLMLFVSGYILYASLMAGAGALVPKMKEAGIANFIATIPLILGAGVGVYSPLLQSSEAFIPVLFSLFPLTAPVVMVMRLAEGAVPTWQVLCSVGLTCLTALLALRAAAAMFRAPYLLSGQPFSLGRYLRVMMVLSIWRKT